MRTTVTLAHSLNCRAAISEAWRTVGTFPPQPISRINTFMVMPTPGVLDLATSSTASFQACHLASCTLSFTHCKSLNIKTAGRADAPQKGHDGQFLPAPKEAATSSASSLGRFESGSLRVPNRRWTLPTLALLRPPPKLLFPEVSFASDIPLERSASESSPRGEDEAGIDSGARIVLVSTANLNGSGALQVLLQQGVEAPHCHTSVFPWHSRTSQGSKKSNECASTLEV
mmetsp:Transcript_43585/g.78270  ORF Transcript_43585/g.78270 Transcript_43585/m.78270 type:complete len:229 (+) Transcript_43585:303-989(+)